MYLRPLLAVGVLAVQATAFLVPLEVAEHVQAAKAQLESLVQSSQAQTVSLACPGCVYPGPEWERFEYSPTDENLLQLKFSIEDSTKFTINDETLFSLETSIEPRGMTAVQIRASDLVPSAPVHVGYALEFLPAVSFAHDEGEIITLQFTTLALDGVPVQVDTVKIDLYRNSAGLSIAKLSSIPFANTPGAAECATSLCRLRAILSARLRAVLQAARSRAQSASSWMRNRGGCRDKKHASQQGERPPFHHGHHGHHHSIHRFGHILRQTLRFFIVPALLGVIGGLMASAVGMLVGHAIVYLWFRFHRGGRRGNNARIVETALASDEKQPLVDDKADDDNIDDQELPPRYDDIPTIVVEEAKE